MQPPLLDLLQHVVLQLASALHAEATVRRLRLALSFSLLFASHTAQQFQMPFGRSRSLRLRRLAEMLDEMLLQTING